MCEFLFYEYLIKNRVVAQLVVFLVWDQEVAGSSPAYPTKKYFNIIQLNLVVWHNICIFVYEITGVSYKGLLLRTVNPSILVRVQVLPQTHI